MTFKKTIDTEVDDSWRRKGHIHEGVENLPDVCPDCGGLGEWNGEECERCQGTGEVYE
jgi:DnaJ-class molecular chaperone